MADADRKAPRYLPYTTGPVRSVWGDDDSGKLPDWWYADDSSCNIFALPPGGAVLHSEQNKAIFGADEIFYVLEGEMVMNNPLTGEVVHATQGEAGFFRKDTWHHVWNYSDTAGRFLEFFLPAPTTGTGDEHAAKHEYLPPEQWKHVRDDLLGRWPFAQAEVEAERTMWLVNDENSIWRMEGTTRGRQILTNLLVSTDNVTMGKMHFLPGQRSDPFTHNGNKMVFVEQGTVHVEFPETGQWFELGPRDAAQIYAGTPHIFYNLAGERSRALFSVSPDYRPAAGAA